MTESDSNPYEAYSKPSVRDFNPNDLQRDSTGKYGVFWVYPQVVDSNGLPDPSNGRGGYLEQRYYLPIEGNPYAHIKGRSVTGDLRLNNDPLTFQLAGEDDIYKLEMALGVVELRTIGNKLKKIVGIKTSLRPGTLFSVKPLLGPVENSQQTSANGLGSVVQESG